MPPADRHSRNRYGSTAVQAEPDAPTGACLRSRLRWTKGQDSRQSGRSAALPRESVISSSRAASVVHFVRARSRRLPKHRAQPAPIRAGRRTGFVARLPSSAGPAKGWGQPPGSGHCRGCRRVSGTGTPARGSCSGRVSSFRRTAATARLAGNARVHRYLGGQRPRHLVIPGDPTRGRCRHRRMSNSFTFQRPALGIPFASLC